MKKNILLYISLIFMIVGIIMIYMTVLPKEYVVKNSQFAMNIQEWYATEAYVINKANIVANIDSKQIKSNTNGIFMSDSMVLMIPVAQIRESFDCAVSRYDIENILIQKGNRSIRINAEIGLCEIDGKQLSNSGYIFYDGDICLPVSLLCDTFGYQYSFDIATNQANIVSLDAEKRVVPYRYNYEDIGRAPRVSNQGNLGTCWAFAALTAMSSTLMPEEEKIFSVDHMSLTNSFNLGQDEGGDYSMAMSYLLAWQGPVLESDDPYGDGVANTDAEIVKHVQEVQVIEAKDLEGIKKMIFKYGGVQSSFFASVLSKAQDTKYYNARTNAYCYMGDEKPNHDIVIIGWDDNYSKDNFNLDVEGDGAFICRNSWGDDFGNNGNFYISYYDTNIGVHNVAYTKIEDTDNYDNIYQTDLCGCVGKLGYDEDTAYFANVYTPADNEELKAVGFYATGIDTEYSIYICEEFKDVNSLSKRTDPVMTGKLKNSGYYTINLDNAVKLQAGRKFAIIVRITTPNSGRPVAVEYVYDKLTETVTIDDGEGYVSMKGINWYNTESNNECNVCLKAYTDNVN